MKKWLSALLVLVLLLVLGIACVHAETRTFIDSTGREVEIDEKIERIAVTGPLAQIMVFAIAPDELVALANEWNEGSENYIAEKYMDLPLLGQLYGGKGQMNLEELLAAAPQVVIDIGRPIEGVKEDMDALTEQTGIPFVHIAATTEAMDETYAMLGELLDKPEEAAALSAYCRSAYDRAKAISESVDKARILYMPAITGFSVLAKGSYHSEVIDMMGDNLAVVDNPSSKGTGNEVSMEQVMLWNPDVVIFGESGGYEEAMGDPLWQTVSAGQNGKLYQAPFGVNNWMGNPPAVQRLLGMLWMGKLLYPEAADYDMYEEAARYYKLFYHCDLTQEMYDALVARSLGK